MSGFTLDRVRKFCIEHEIETLFNDDLQQLAIRRVQSDVPFRVIPRPGSEMLTLASIIPGTVPPAAYPDVAKALVKANGTVFMGAWILAPSSGELYFRVTVREALPFTDEHMNYLLTVVSVEFDRRAKRLWAVATGALDVDDF